MKLNHFLTLASALLLGTGSLVARTWTSSDGKRTFEGELKTYDTEKGHVTVTLKNGQDLSFTLDKLSKADQTFLANAAPATPVAPAKPVLRIADNLAKEGVVMKLKGKDYVAHKLTKSPEFYLLYFSASW